MHKKAFILTNIPASYYRQELITDYIEGTLDIDVKDVRLHPFTPETALVLVDGIIDDFDAARKALQKNPLGSQVLKLVRAQKESAVIVENFDGRSLSAEELGYYFNSEFAAGKDVIETAWLQPHLQIAVIKFLPSEKKVVQKILKKKDHVPLPSENYHISVSPFYRNFHEYTQQQQGLEHEDERVQDARETTKLRGSSSPANAPKQSGRIAKNDLAQKSTQHRGCEANLTKEMDIKVSWSKRQNEIGKKSSKNNDDDTYEEKKRSESKKKREKKIREKDKTKGSTDEEEKEQGKMDGKDELGEKARDMDRSGEEGETEEIDNSDNEASEEEAGYKSPVIAKTFKPGIKDKEDEADDDKDEGATEESDSPEEEEDSEGEGLEEEGGGGGSRSPELSKTLKTGIQDEDDNADEDEEAGASEESDMEEEEKNREEEGSGEEETGYKSPVLAKTLKSGIKDEEDEADDYKDEGTTEESDTPEEEEDSEEEGSEEEEGGSRSPELTKTLKTGIQDEDNDADEDEDTGESEESDVEEEKKNREKKGSGEKGAGRKKPEFTKTLKSGIKDEEDEAYDDKDEGTTEESDTQEEEEDSEGEGSEEEGGGSRSPELTKTLKPGIQDKQDGAESGESDSSEKTDDHEEEESDEEESKISESELTEDRSRFSHKVCATDRVRGSHPGRGRGNKFSAKSGKDTIRKTHSYTGEYTLSEVQQETQASSLKKTHLPVPSKNPKQQKSMRGNFRARGPGHSTRKDPEGYERDKWNTRQNSASAEECETRTRQIRSSSASAEDIPSHPGTKKSSERPRHKLRGRGGSKYVPASSGRQGMSSRIGKSQDRKDDPHSCVYEDPEFLKAQKEEGQKRLLEEKYKRAQEENTKLKLKEENTKLKEKITEKLDLEPFRVALIQHCFGQFGECSVTYGDKEKCIVLTGPDDVVKKKQIEVLMEIQKIKEKVFELCPDMIAIFTSDAGKQYIENLNKCDLNGARAFFDGKSLAVIANEENILKAAEDKLQHRLNHTITLSAECKIPQDKLRTLQDRLEHKLLVKMSWNEECTSVFVKGIRDDVMKCEADIQELIKECEVWEKTFTVNGPRAKYFSKVYSDKINFLVREAEIVHSDISDQRVIIRFKGTKTQIDEVSSNLQKLRDQVNLERWALTSEFQGQAESALIAHALESSDIQSKIEHTEFSEKCCVIIEASQGATSEPSEQWAHHNARPHKTFKKKAPDELKLKVTANCQLVIKSFGDITKERSELLVSTLTQNADLRKTRVGQAFNKACSSLWKKLKNEFEAHPSDAVLTTQGPFQGLKCQAICHAILTPWEPNTSPTQLENAVKTVLGQAKALSVTSISFPALGCGKAFKFPPQSVAQIVLSNIDPANISSSLTKIVLLAPDRVLYRELKKEAEKKFQADATKTEGAVGGAERADSDESEEGTDEEEEQTLEDMRPFDLPISNDLDIVIASEKDPAAIWSELKEKLREHCLSEHTYSQKILHFWPKDSQLSIFQEAKKQFVWMEKHEDAKSNQPGFKLKGEKTAVNKVKDYIGQEFEKLVQNRPKQSLKSKQAPVRGTVEFLKFASDSDEMFPSYWKLTKKLKKMKKDEPSKNVKEEQFLVTVDSKTKAAIEKLVKSTWDPSRIGLGNDAKGLNFTDIEILNVQRIENPYMFEKYQMHRKGLFRKMAKEDQICQDVGTLPGSKGRITTTEKLEDFMKEELYYEINEHYLFHGTQKGLIPALSRNGLDPKVSSQSCMFGKGIYAAEQFTKSDQYTDRQQRTQLGTELTVILSRMLLGNVFVCDHTHPSVANKDAQKLTRPPCMLCKQDICGCHRQQLYDSVMGDGKWIFREFVVYDQSYCYPEYVITYKRI